MNRQFLETIDIDKVYEKADQNGDGYLQMEEARHFFQMVADQISEQRLWNYNPKNFESLFITADDDKNGFLSKPEFAIMVKQVFKKPKDLTKQGQKEKFKLKQLQTFDLQDKMQSWLDKYEKEDKHASPINVDTLWEEADLDQNGFLDRDEAKAFIGAVSMLLKPSRAQNYDPIKFD